MAENPVTPSPPGFIYASSPPWIYVGRGDDERKAWIPSFYYQRPPTNVCVRKLRGWKMQTARGLMDEFGAALQFFDGFGENWGALGETLSYMDEWLPADVYVLVVERSEDVLSLESDNNLTSFLHCLNDAGNYLGNPITENGPYNRPAIPLHALLYTEDVDRAERIKEFARIAGIPIRADMK